MKKELIKKSYQLAKEQYAALGVDTVKFCRRWINWLSAFTAGKLMMLAVSKGKEMN
jgi:hypothetical protein